MTDTCTIRSLTYADLGDVLAWRNHPDVRRFMFTQHEISMSEHLQWYENTLKIRNLQMLIVEESDQALGYVQLSDVTPHGVADWGFYTKPGAPKGSGYKLGKTALNYAFKILQLHKICGQALEFNQASVSFHRRLGFSQEGFLREQKNINGQRHNLICFGLLAEEWTDLL